MNEQPADLAALLEAAYEEHLRIVSEGAPAGFPKMHDFAAARLAAAGVRVTGEAGLREALAEYGIVTASDVHDAFGHGGIANGRALASPSAPAAPPSASSASSGGAAPQALDVERLRKAGRHVRDLLLPFYGDGGEETKLRRCGDCGRTSPIVPMDAKPEDAPIQHESNCTTVAVLSVLAALALPVAAPEDPTDD